MLQRGYKCDNRPFPLFGPELPAGREKERKKNTLTGETHAAQKQKTKIAEEKAKQARIGSGTTTYPKKKRPANRKNAIQKKNPAMKKAGQKENHAGTYAGTFAGPPQGY